MVKVKSIGKTVFRIGCWLCSLSLLAVIGWSVITGWISETSWYADAFWFSHIGEPGTYTQWESWKLMHESAYKIFSVIGIGLVLGSLLLLVGGATLIIGRNFKHQD